jgi:predicted alpha/beta-fold hydrolase
MTSNPSDLAARWQGMIHSRPFRPHRWIRNAHLQTIVGAKQHRRFAPPVQQPISDAISLSDGARIEICRFVIDPEAPTLTAVHGMSGSSRSDYMVAFSRKAMMQGWNALLFNLYDRCGKRKIPRLFDAGCAPQLAEALELLRAAGKLGDLFIVGVSMGGNIVLKTLGNWGDSTPDWVLGGAVISPLMDLNTSWQSIERPSNWIYRAHYLRRLKQLTLEHRPGWESRVDFAALAGVRSIRQYDEMVTVPVGGYRDAEDYYAQASAAPVIGHIQVPTLAIHSFDDPFLPWEPLTRSEVKENPWIDVVLTERGGHVGFIEDSRIDSDRIWSENRVIDFFSTVLRSCRCSSSLPARGPQH